MSVTKSIDQLGLFAALLISGQKTEYKTAIEEAAKAGELPFADVERVTLFYLANPSTMRAQKFDDSAVRNGDFVVDNFCDWCLENCRDDTVATQRIESAIRDAYPFSAETRPLLGPGGETTKHFGIFRSDNNECIGNAVRQSYCPHQTDDIVALATAASAAFEGDCKVDCSWRDGHRVVVTPSDSYRLKIFENGDRNDSVFPRLVITAGYDGRAFSGVLGVFRDACSNLQIPRMVSGNTTKIRHTAGLSLRLDELKQTFSTIAARWQQTAEVLQEMEGRKVHLADFVAQVYPETKSKKRDQKRVAAIFNRVLDERRKTGRDQIGSDFMVTGFEAYQAVNGYEIWDKPRRKKTETIDRLFDSFDSKPSQFAEKLALATA